VFHVKHVLAYLYVSRCTYRGEHTAKRWGRGGVFGGRKVRIAAESAVQIIDNTQASVWLNGHTRVVITL
jgi:hypothetical protein